MDLGLVGLSGLLCECRALGSSLKPVLAPQAKSPRTEVAVLT